MAESIKEKGVDFLKEFGAELGLVFYEDDILQAMKGLCAPYTPEGWKQLIKNAEPLSAPKPFYDFISAYKSYVKDYSTEQLAEMMLELIDKIRPDLSKVVLSSTDDGAERAWFYQSIQMIKDRIANPERYMEELEKPLMMKVICDSCGKSWRIFKEDAEQMQRCPFCEVGGKEEIGHPPEDLVA